MQLSLFLASAAEELLLLAAARRADLCGLTALWLPESHPAVLAAAVSVATRRLGVRAGGLALPLHNPIRVAEEWSLVDNLSHGRAGIAFASADDPEGGIETVRRLWRGEAARVPDGEGRPIEVRILPQPIQRELPIWLTGGRDAAELGAHLLLAAPAGDLIAAYRAAGGNGRVTAAIPSFASVEEGLREADRLQAIGVDEIACRVRLADALDAVEVLDGMLQEMEVGHGG
jgi:alkanesulfonate monooxygenase SsuD/methylene tetrahydromethanopterin reductase-like flavin-dependent oxidoreductase (luciferase family)